jgi:hypothetical protein
LQFPENKNDYDDSDVHPTFELEHEIETLNYVPLVTSIPLDGITRIFEDAEDSYTDLLEEGDSENDLEYMHSDVDGENENKIAQSEIDLPYEFRWEERIKLDYQCMSFTNKKGKKK